MNTLGLGRKVESLGLGVPYEDATPIITGFIEIARFSLNIFRKIMFSLEG